jgi:hypothetical protein
MTRVGCCFNDAVEQSPLTSRVVLGGHKHDGSLLMLLAPLRKRPTFACGARVAAWSLHHIVYAKPARLPNLPCGRILVREPAADEFLVFLVRGVGKDRN